MINLPGLRSCKVRNRLMLTWYKTGLQDDKQAYMDHLVNCPDCINQAKQITEFASTVIHPDLSEDQIKAI